MDTSEWRYGISSAGAREVGPDALDFVKRFA